MENMTDQWGDKENYLLRNSVWPCDFVKMNQLTEPENEFVFVEHQLICLLSEVVAFSISSF